MYNSLNLMARVHKMTGMMCYLEKFHKRQYRGPYFHT